METIKKIADDLGVSKQAITDKVDYSAHFVNRTLPIYSRQVAKLITNIKITAPVWNGDFYIAKKHCQSNALGSPETYLEISTESLKLTMPLRSTSAQKYSRALSVRKLDTYSAIMTESVRFIRLS